jgi:hypothetical protein
LLSVTPIAFLPGIRALDFAYRPAIQEAANGMDAWLLIESIFSEVNLQGMVDGESAGISTDGVQAVQMVLLAALVMPLLAWASTAFLSGGLVLTLSEASSPFRMRRFLWGCWHWFGVFLVFGLMKSAVGLFVLAPVFIGALGALAASPAWLGWVTIFGLSLILVIWISVNEFTYIFTVEERGRNIFRAFGKAAAFVLQNFTQVVVFYLFWLCLLAGVHAIFRLGIFPMLSLEIWLVAMIVQQVFILLRLWARVARMGTGIALKQEIG